jgi:hypothetical protein
VWAISRPLPGKHFLKEWNFSRGVVTQDGDHFLFADFVVAAAVGILIAAMLTFAANNAPVAIAQAERPYPPEVFVLPATLITDTPEQCAALPDPQQPESTECVRKRGKEYAGRLAQWLEEHSNLGAR